MTNELSRVSPMNPLPTPIARLDECVERIRNDAIGRDHRPNSDLFDKHLKMLMNAVIGVERKRIEEVVMPKIQKFIDKVESGKARSRETYADMLLIKELFNQ